MTESVCDLIVKKVQKYKEYKLKIQQQQKMFDKDPLDMVIKK